MTGEFMILQKYLSILSKEVKDKYFSSNLRKAGKGFEKLLNHDKGECVN